MSTSSSRRTHQEESADVVSQGNPSVGGHGNAIQYNGGWVTKQTNVTESQFYQRLDPGDPLQEFVPECDYADEGGRIKIRNMTTGLKGPITLLDIKVGSSTASREELMDLQGMSGIDSRIKKAKMKISDVLTGSAERGWRVVGGKFNGIPLEDTRLDMGRDSARIVRRLIAETSLEKIQLVSKLRGLQNAARNAGYAFIAASVLIAVGSDGKLRVNLIDFAHTFSEVDLPAILVAKYRQKFLNGLANLINEIDAISPFAALE